MAVALLSQLRTRLELILSVASSDAYVGSTTELDDINLAYEKTAYAYNWPQMLIRVGIPITANVDRYLLPTGFRKIHFLKVLDITYDETELEVLKKSRRKYAVDRNGNEIILADIPSTTATTYTLSNSPSAGAAASITITSATGLTQFDEIFIDSVSGTDEFTLVSSISGTTVTARLRAAKSSSDVFYRQKEIIDIFYYRNIVLLSGATDTMLVADELDYVVPHYAAYIAYTRLEDFAKAKEHLAIWEDGIKRSFIAQDQQSTGGAGQMVIGL